MAYQRPDFLGTHEEVFGDGAEAAEVLTTGFVSTDTFRLEAADVVVLETTLSGTAATTVHLKLEVSFDNGTSYKIVDGFSDFQLDGATSSHFDALSLFPYATYKLSVKRTGGDVTTAAVIFGSSRKAQSSTNVSVSELGASATEGDVAHDAADSGNPLKVGGRARTSQISAVSNNDRTDLITNAYGEVIVAGYDWTESAVNTQGNVADDAVDSGNPVSVGGIARSAQRSAVAALDRVKATFNIYGEAVLAGYDWSLNALRASVINPDSDQYVGGQFSETDQDTNTTIYHYINMSGYRGCTIQCNVTQGTDTVTVSYQGSCQDDGTAAASCFYTALTQYGFTIQSQAATAANYTADHMISLEQYVGVRYIRITATTDNSGGNDADHQIDYKLWY